MFRDIPLLLKRLEEGKTNISEVYRQCHGRIVASENETNALTTPVTSTVIERCISQAEELSDTLLRGLPVLVKDSIATKELPTTNGKKTVEIENNARIVTRLKKAGAVVLAKTNLPPGAMDYQSINPVFGTVANPVDKTRTAGGSSGGSAAGVALGYAPFAVGSDMGGSLRVPANFCGIAAFRPSLGSLPVEGHLTPEDFVAPHNFELTVGPMAGDMASLSVLHQAMGGGAPRSSKDVKIVLTPQLGTLTPSAEVLRTMQRLENADGITIEIVEEPGIDLELVVKAHAAMVDYAIGKESWTVDEMKSAQLEIRQQIEKLLQGFDAWALPVNPMTAPPHNPEHKRITVGNQKVNYWVAMGYYCWPVSVGGLPSTSIPTMQKSHLENLPVGIQLVGEFSSDPQLLGTASEVEKVMRLK